MVLVLVVLLVLAAAVGAVLWRRSSEPAPVASSVRCSAFWRPSADVAPRSAGDVTLVTRNPPLGTSEQRLQAGRMTFIARVPNEDPGMRQPGPGADGSDLIIEVTDDGGRRVVLQSYQIWSGPTDSFGGDSGFTGLVYVNDPASGAEVQYSCRALT